MAYRRLLKQAWSGVTRKFVSRLHHLNDAVAALSINLEAGESAIRQRPLLADTGGSRSRPSDPVTAWIPVLLSALGSWPLAPSVEDSSSR